MKLIFILASENKLYLEQNELELILMMDWESVPKIHKYLELEIMVSVQAHFKSLTKRLHINIKNKYSLTCRKDKR